MSEARAALDAGITEKAFQAAVVELARLCRWRCYHTYDSRRSTPGFPDLVLLRGNRLIFAELKRQRGTVTVDQRGWLAALAATGAVDVRLWRPSDWPDIEATLR